MKIPTIKLSVFKGTNAFQGMPAEVDLFRRTPRECCSSGLDEAVIRGMHI